MKLFIKGLLFISLLLSTFLTTNASVKNIRFEEVHSVNFLPQNMVLSIHQDKLGFLWLGTINGLYKYDGYQFKDYSLSQISTNRSYSNRVISIKEEQSGKLWFKTYDGRMHRFDPTTETFINFPLESEDQNTTIINDYYQAKNNIICLSTSNSGIYLIRDDSTSTDINVTHINNNADNPAIFSSNNILFTTEDTNGDLWLGTDNGLNKIESNNLFSKKPNIRHYFATSANNPKRFNTTCHIAQGNLLWFGTQYHGLVCFDANRDLFNRFIGSTVFNNLSDHAITTLVVKENLLWAGNDNGQIISYDQKTDLFETYELPEKFKQTTIQKLFIDHYNQLWILTNKFGIVRFDTNTKESVCYKLTPDDIENSNDDERTVIYEDNKNNLWLGVQNVGVLQYDRTNDEFVTNANNINKKSSLSSNVVECLYQDREGSMWVGTSLFGKGLSRVITTDEAFDYIQPVKNQTNKIQNIMRSLFYDSNGYVWAASKSGKVYIYNNNEELIHTMEKSAISNYSGHNVYSIIEDKTGHIWFASKGGGIFKSNETLKSVYPNYNKLTFTNYKYDPNDKNSLINNNSTYDITFDKWNRVWVATYGGGLNMIDFRDDAKGKSTFFTTSNSGLSGDKTRDICIDSNGRLWLGTTYGLNYVDIYKKEVIDSAMIKNVLVDNNNKNALTYNDIAMITETKNGELWLATLGGGVNIISNPKDSEFNIRSLTTKEGLAANIAFSLLEDSIGDIWIGTEFGLSIYKAKDKKIFNFGKKQGLPEIFFTEHACALTPNQNKLFGTVNGFYIIKDKVNFSRQTSADICFTSFQLYNKEVFPGQPGSPLKKAITYTKEIELKHNQANFAIGFSLMSFLAPESNLFKYKLEGFEEDWNFISEDHKATYTNLSPGEYIFRVKSANPEIEDTISEATLKITIKPGFWATTNAYILYSIIIALLIFIALRITIRMTKLKNNVLVEHRIAESKLRFFTNISHEFRTPLTLILGPVENMMNSNSLSDKNRQELSIVYKNTNRLLRMVNQLLDFRKVMNGKVQLKIQEVSIVPFIDQISGSYKELAKRKKIEFSVICENRDLTIWGDVQKLDIAIFNLLSNAFKFTGENKSISIIVEDLPESNQVTIKVKDTGIGIDADKVDFVFDRFYVSHSQEETGFDGAGIGLALCHEYITLHKGTIGVTSTKGEGSEFTITLQKGNSHFPTEIINYTEKSLGHLLPEQKPVEEEVQNTLSDNDQNQATNRDELPELLVVEDDLEMSEYIKDVLSENFKVYLAKDGEDGLAQAKQITPDLIITDVMMPKMNGIDMTKELKSDFETCHIPVIMLTAKSDVVNQIEGIETGAEAYIPKPFNLTILLSYINTLLSQRENVKAKFDNIVELKPDEIKVQPKDKIFIEKVIKLIEENMADSDFNVEKLAGMLNVSRTLFYKKIKNITGYQPIELMRTIRLKKAAQLLETGDYNITEVAYMLGYNDIRYFSTTFKKQYGKSPSIYQKEFKEASK